jgi:hypothetical protein
LVLVLVMVLRAQGLALQLRQDSVVMDHERVIARLRNVREHAYRRVEWERIMVVVIPTVSVVGDLVVSMLELRCLEVRH